MSELPVILVVDDKPNMLSLLTKILRSLGEVRSAASLREAQAALALERVDAVLCDLRLPDGDGLELLKLLKTDHPGTPFILMTAYATIPTAVRAIRDGALDYVTKPFDPDAVRALVAQALRSTMTCPAPAHSPAAAASTRETPAADEDRFVDLSFREALDASRSMTSRRYVVAVLRRFRGDVAAAAGHAEIERESFYRLMRRYGLSASEFRTSGEEK